MFMKTMHVGFYCFKYQIKMNKHVRPNAMICNFSGIAASAQNAAAILIMEMTYFSIYIYAVKI